jgi:membrane associated rhomboid family serine protease
MAAYLAYVYAWVCTSFQYVCFVFFGRLWRVLGSKKFLFFYISCGLGAALMHTGINYYYFNDAINTLAANGFLRGSSSVLNQGKNKHTMAGAINRVAISKFH